jgi:hypothetical protein
VEGMIDQTQRRVQADDRSAAAHLIR